MKCLYQEFKTAQAGPHKDLERIVARYEKTIFQRPIPDHQEAAFKKILNFLDGRPIILDSGCGTGLSTKKLAQQFPDHQIIGIDKSFLRLNRHLWDRNQRNNYLLVRADVIDLWRLLSTKHLPISHHFIFFPNPWPKISQYKRRFYAHPVFATMVALAPYLEVRTNWRIYAEELVIALKVIGIDSRLAIKRDDNYMSLFEKKYLAAQCEIFIVTANRATIQRIA